MHDACDALPDARRERRSVVRQPLMKAAREAIPLPLQYAVKLLPRLIDARAERSPPLAFHWPHEC